MKNLYILKHLVPNNSQVNKQFKAPLHVQCHWFESTWNYKTTCCPFCTHPHVPVLPTAWSKVNVAMSGGQHAQTGYLSSHRGIRMLPQMLILTRIFQQLIRARILVVSDMRSETKGSQFESGCQLCPEVSSLQ